MSNNNSNPNRRTLLKQASLAGVGTLLGNVVVQGSPPLRLSLNENAYGPSHSVQPAIQSELQRIARYADESAAERFAQQIAEHEQVPAEQVLLGEILDVLGLHLGSQGGPGGEFIYSSPGYLALINAAGRVGGKGVPVPLNAHYQNDLPAIEAKINGNTRAIYLVNPHNPTGTTNGNAEFQSFLRRVSLRTLAIVDEAYLEYMPDFAARSAVKSVRTGANVLVFRTFDKIHGLAGMPIGYVLAPRELAAALRKEGVGSAEALGRLNLAAAAAALRDTSRVDWVRNAVAGERTRWTQFLDSLGLAHTEACGSFVFFDTGHPQPEIAAALRAGGIEIGRAHPPYTNWARITIGLPEENARAQSALRTVLQR